LYWPKAAAAAGLRKCGCGVCLCCRDRCDCSFDAELDFDSGVRCGRVSLCR
ncbi:unnamed protein product, partial [Amoebophrya sp. A25]